MILDSSICKCANVSLWADYSFFKFSFLDSQTLDPSILETQIVVWNKESSEHNLITVSLLLRKLSNTLI
jgi:hypothetical protein